MKNLVEQSDSEYESNIEKCNINPNEFDHIAHLRLAWINIKKYGIDKAIIRVPAQIQKLVETFNVAEKYHTTLTIAAINTVYHFMQKSKSRNFQDFIVEFPKLKNDFMDLIFSHYSNDRLMHSKAKSQFICPDLLPFD